MHALCRKMERSAGQAMKQLFRVADRPFTRTLRCGFKWLPVLLLLAALFQFVPGCGTTVQTKSRKVANVELSQYRTFEFAQATVPSDARFLSPTSEARVKAAIQAELEKRGWRRATPADLELCFYLKTATKTYDKTAPVTGSGSFSSDVRTYYGFLYDDDSWGTKNVVTYPEGTLVVQAVDRKQNCQVWEGVATGVIYRNHTEKQVEARIREAVADMFKTFPES